jgi:hypothetical protein
MFSSGSSPVDEAWMALSVAASVRGINSGVAPNIRNIAVEARPTLNNESVALNNLYTSAIIRGIRGDDVTKIAPIFSDRTDLVNARVSDTIWALYTNAMSSGIDHTGAAVNRSSQARVVGTTPLDERYYGLYSLAFVRGINTGAAAGSKGLAVEARPLGLSPAIPVTVNGLVTYASVLAYDPTTANFQSMCCDVQAIVSGRLAAAIRALYTNSLVTGIDNTAPANPCLRPVAVVGAVSASASQLEAAYSMSTMQSRESAFMASSRGKRFAITHQTPGTLTTCQTSFVATTPSFMLRVNSASVRTILRSLSLSLDNTPGGNVYITLAIDTADRWSAGGNAWTPQNMNEESVTAAVALFYDTPTASAAGAGTRYIMTTIAPPVPGSMINIDLKDGLLLGPTAATLLIYVWAATTAPQVILNGEYEEVT